MWFFNQLGDSYFKFPCAKVLAWVEELVGKNGFIKYPMTWHSRERTGRDRTY